MTIPRNAVSPTSAKPEIEELATRSAGSDEQRYQRDDGPDNDAYSRLAGSPNMSSCRLGHAPDRHRPSRSYQVLYVGALCVERYGRPLARAPGMQVGPPSLQWLGAAPAGTVVRPASSIAGIAVLTMRCVGSLREEAATTSERGSASPRFDTRPREWPVIASRPRCAHKAVLHSAHRVGRRRCCRALARVRIWSRMALPMIPGRERAANAER